MPSNNRNAQNKIKAQKAKALREKLGHTKKEKNEELSTYLENIIRKEVKVEEQKNKIL